jgi:hypothetical protein
LPRGSTPRSGRVPVFDGSRTVLPREGRQAPAPAWPLPGTPSPREAQLWELEGSRPQALIWERDALENDVALYVRKRAEAETPGSSSASVDTMRRLQDDLLLTIPAMRRAGVAIAQPQAEPGTSRPGGATLVPIHGSPGSRTRQALGHRTAKERFTRTTNPATTPAADAATTDQEDNPA